MCVCVSVRCVCMGVCVFCVVSFLLRSDGGAAAHEKRGSSGGRPGGGGGQDGTEKVQTRQNRGDCPKKGKGSDDA